MSDQVTCDLIEGESPHCYCPLTGVIEVLSRKYAMQSICVIGAHNSVRFSDLEAHLPTASTSTLSTRLDELVEAGLVEREQYNEIPPRVEYALSPEGEELCDRLTSLLEWASERDE